MSKLRDALCNSIKEHYPTISAKADAEYFRQWGDFAGEEYYSYSWFEALANALNREMCNGIPASNFIDLFATVSANYSQGDEDIRKAIDVAFVENLFWQVPGSKAVDYWATLPDTLKQLYVNFHHRTPL